MIPPLVVCRAGALAAALAALTAGAACREGSTSGPQSGDVVQSPNASLRPAPLESPGPAGAPEATAAAPQGMLLSGGRLVPLDAGAPPPEPLRPEAPLRADTLAARDLGGVSLELVLRWRAVPAPPRAPEVDAEALRAAQAATALSLRADLAEGGRMRVVVTSRAFPLAQGSELRARLDRLGHLLVWPNATSYRVVPAGALRAIVGERRVDVAPLSAGTVTPAGEGRRLVHPVRRHDVAAPLGKARFDVARIAEAGEGATLFCRMLVELLGVDPRSSFCQPGELILAADYAWPGGGGIALEVRSVVRRNDLAYGDLIFPPPAARFQDGGLPAVPQGVFLTRDELLRTRSSPLPPGPIADPEAPGEGVLAVNATERLVYLLLDGVPVASVPPLGEQYVIGPPRGRYVAQWRTFLGEIIEPPTTVELPARLVHGAPDGGAPPGP